MERAMCVTWYLCHMIQITKQIIGTFQENAYTAVSAFRHTEDFKMRSAETSQFITLSIFQSI